ncbi:hypothetical protein [Azohydromonas sediminis]|uniref:hypothetical protein n=1 Tax=Azohydromonas sediminis TaxID=2259674 RepID=UPI0013C2C51D|nr:hypothetical protein [Azohydromonas sediminis]
MTTSRLPRQLTAKYHELMRERVEASARIEELDREIAALEYAMRVLDPEWEPPTRTQKKQRPSRLPPGVLSRDCLAVLKEAGELWTPEIAQRIAARRRIQFVDRKDELDFASAVAMALRRYERQQFLEVVDREARTGAFKWRIRTDAASAAQAGALQ